MRKRSARIDISDDDFEHSAVQPKKKGKQLPQNTYEHGPRFKQGFLFWASRFRPKSSLQLLLVVELISHIFSKKIDLPLSLEIFPSARTDGLWLFSHSKGF